MAAGDAGPVWGDEENKLRFQLSLFLQSPSSLQSPAVITTGQQAVTARKVPIYQVLTV